MGYAMGTFFTRCKIENSVAPDRLTVVPRILVDTGSEYTWVPATILEKIGIKREKKDLADSKKKEREIIMEFTTLYMHEQVGVAECIKCCEGLDRR